MFGSDFNDSSISLLAKIYKWRKHILIVTASAAIISIIASYLIAPQYRSTAIVFPSRSFSVSKLIIEQNNGNQEDYMELGDEDDAEKLLQILNSEEIRVMTANKLNLWSNWKIDTGKLANHYLRLKWDEMVSFKRTDYVSIRIDVYDYYAYRAAEIANCIVDLADSVKTRMTKEVADKALAIVADEYASTIKRMNELEDSLQTLRQLGVLDYKEQVQAYSKSYAKAVEKGDNAAMKRLESKMDTLKKYGGAYQHINENLKKYRFKYPVIKGKYDEALVNSQKSLPFKFVVDRATPNEKKAKPVRWLIVTISTLSAFFLSLMFLLGIDRYKSFKKKIEEHLNSQKQQES